MINNAGLKTTTTPGPLHTLHQLGQSIWLDYIRRHLITSGELRRLVEESGVTGLTANPSIFEKAILGSTDYEDALGAIARRGNRRVCYVAWEDDRNGNPDVYLARRACGDDDL